MDNNVVAFIFNTQGLKTRRRVLRNQPTDVEKLLWSKIRHRQIGHKFVRQFSIGPYIIDFYCPARRLAVELDGEQHNDKETAIYDQDRTEFLNLLNIKVIRFWNNEVINEINSVVERITEAIKNSPS